MRGVYARGHARIQAEELLNIGIRPGHTHYRVTQSPDGKLRLDLEDVPREIRRVASSRGMFSVIPGFILGPRGRGASEEQPEGMEYLREGNRECAVDEGAISAELKEFVRAEIGMQAAKLGFPVKEYEEKTNMELFGGGKTLSQILEEMMDEGGKLETPEMRELGAGDWECKVEEEAVTEELKEFVRAEIERERQAN